LIEPKLLGSLSLAIYGEKEKGREDGRRWGWETRGGKEIVPPNMFDKFTPIPVPDLEGRQPPPFQTFSGIATSTAYMAVRGRYAIVCPRRSIILPRL